MMPFRSSPPGVPSAITVAFLNAVPSVVWSVLAFGPVVLYCYRYVAPAGLWAFVGVSLLAYAWPGAWLRRLQLSRHAAVYRQLRVPLVGRFAQGGALVNGLLRRRYPAYRALPGRQGVARLLRTTYQQERFHWAGLLFFTSLGLHAGWAGQWRWAAGLTLANIGYNLYPIWLQQYLRVRVGKG
jgi:hypothetical protein